VPQAWQCEWGTGSRKAFSFDSDVPLIGIPYLFFNAVLQILDQAT
jgi:hypothetical protein